MKSQDVVVLLKLVSLSQQAHLDGAEQIRESSQGLDPFSVRGLEASLGISKSEVSASIRRSVSSGLAIQNRQLGRIIPNKRNLLNFIVHGLKFVFPVKPGHMTRGVLTGHSAPVVEGLHGGRFDYVWPYAKGEHLGQEVAALYRTVPSAALLDEILYEYLALVDCIRLGKSREINFASDRLAESFAHENHPASAL